MPVTKLESSEARNTAALATSSGSPMRPIGMVVSIRDGREAWLERSYNGRCHTGIEQDGRVTTVDESQGIVMLCRRYRS
jgi:hypothetical protein